jgi:hypothetical protein
MTKFVSSTTSSNPDYIAECDFAFMDIGVEAAKQILARHALFMDAHAKDKSLWEMYFWDSLPEWFDGCENSKWFAKHKIEDPDCGVDSVADAITLEGVELQRTECDQMIICEEGVRWTCVPKHTSIYVTSETIPIGWISKVVDDEAEQ